MEKSKILNDLGSVVAFCVCLLIEVLMFYFDFDVFFLIIWAMMIILGLISEFFGKFSFKKSLLIQFGIILFLATLVLSYLLISDSLSKDKTSYNYKSDNDVQNDFKSDGGANGQEFFIYRDYNCTDFSTWSDAQEIFIKGGGPIQDSYGLDKDGDEIACESLMK